MHLLLHSLHHNPQPVPFVFQQLVLAAAVACCWICARKRAERKRHAALGGKVPAALPDIEQPPAQESAAVEQAETEQPTKPLQEGQPMSHPLEQFKMPGANGHCHGTPMQHILSGNSDHAQMLPEQHATAACMGVLQPGGPRHAFVIGHQNGCNFLLQYCSVICCHLDGHMV